MGSAAASLAALVVVEFVAPRSSTSVALGGVELVIAVDVVVDVVDVGKKTNGSLLLACKLITSSNTFADVAGADGVDGGGGTMLS